MREVRKQEEVENKSKVMNTDVALARERTEIGRS